MCCSTSLQSPAISLVIKLAPLSSKVPLESQTTSHHQGSYGALTLAWAQVESLKQWSCVSEVDETVRRETKIPFGCGFINVPTMPLCRLLAPKCLKNWVSHIDASHSRQPLVKGERLVRYEVNAVILSLVQDLGPPKKWDHECARKIARDCPKVKLHLLVMVLVFLQCWCYCWNQCKCWR